MTVLLVTLSITLGNGVTVAVDTSTPLGCHSGRIEPLVVLKFLRDTPKEYENEVQIYKLFNAASYLWTERHEPICSWVSDPDELRLPRFIETFTAVEIPDSGSWSCIVLEHLGPSLHDVMEKMPYRRLTAKMTMAVAIQGVSPLISFYP